MTAAGTRDDAQAKASAHGLGTTRHGRSLAMWLIALLSSCGPAPSTLDWSSPVTPTTAPATTPARLHVDGRALKSSEGREVRLRGVNVCSLEFDETGATWQLQPDGGSPLLGALVDPTRWRANVVRMPVNQERFLVDDIYADRVERLIDASARHEPRLSHRHQHGRLWHLGDGV